MKTLAAIVLMSLSGVVHAQACWGEWNLRGQPVVRASNCTENISPQNLEREFCKPMVEGDQIRRAASCPSSAKVRDGGQVITSAVVARCVGIRPPNAGGKADFVYYGGKDFADSKQSLQSLCTGFEGKWVEVKK